MTALASEEPVEERPENTVGDGVVEENPSSSTTSPPSASATAASSEEVPFNASIPASPSNADKSLQTVLKEKEDELRRKEEELKRKEEAMKELESRVRQMERSMSASVGPMAPPLYPSSRTSTPFHQTLHQPVPTRPYSAHPLSRLSSYSVSFRDGSLISSSPPLQPVLTSLATTPARIANIFPSTVTAHRTPLRSRFICLLIHLHSRIQAFLENG